MAGYIGSKASVVSSGAERKKLFNITTTTTSLTGLAYTLGQVHVFHNGVRLVDGTDYTATNGTSITLTVAAENGDQVAVVSYATFQTSDTVSASTGGTFAAGIDVIGTVAAAAGTALLPSITTTGDLNTGMWFPAADTIAFSEGGVEALRINSSGNVGIGTTVISNKISLPIGQTVNIGATALGGAAHQAGNVGSVGLTITDGGLANGVRVHNTHNGTYSSTDIRFTTGIGGVTTGLERMRINSSGNVGIGTTSPTNGKLEVTHSSSTVPAGFFRNTSGSGNSPALTVQGGANNAAANFSVLDYNGNTDFVVQGAGNVGIGTTVNSLFNAVGGSTKLAVTGSSASTDVLGNTDASIAIINTDTTANNTAGLHFARADTDDNPNYAGASIVTQFHDTQVTGQYPKASMNFLTSTVANAAPSLKMTIDSAGNVGIGTSSPSYLTELYGNGGGDTVTLALTNAGSHPVRLRLNSGHGNWSVGNSITVSDALEFRDESASATRMMINSGGGVLINTTSAVGAGSPRLSMAFDGSTTWLANTNDTVGQSGARHFTFHSNGTEVGKITTTTSATTYATSSDYRLKTDAQPMTGASDRVLALNPVNFEWISSGERVDGFLAHEAQAVVPECVTGTKDAMRDEEYEVTAAVLDADGMVVTEAVMGTRSVPDMQGIDQSKLVPLLTAALQEALTEISALKARVTALEG